MSTLEQLDEERATPVAQQGTQIMSLSLETCEADQWDTTPRLCSPVDNLGGFIVTPGLFLGIFAADSILVWAPLSKWVTL